MKKNIYKIAMFTENKVLNFVITIFVSVILYVIAANFFIGPTLLLNKYDDLFEYIEEDTFTSNYTLVDEINDDVHLYASKIDINQFVKNEQDIKYFLVLIDYEADIDLNRQSNASESYYLLTHDIQVIQVDVATNVDFNIDGNYYNYPSPHTLTDSDLDLKPTPVNKRKEFSVYINVILLGFGIISVIALTDLIVLNFKINDIDLI